MFNCLPCCCARRHSSHHDSSPGGSSYLSPSPNSDTIELTIRSTTCPAHLSPPKKSEGQVSWKASTSCPQKYISESAVSINERPEPSASSHSSSPLRKSTSSPIKNKTSAGPTLAGNKKMGDRGLPLLHVVYAGYGDAMFVEYRGDWNQQQQQQNPARELMAVDGGPRDKAVTKPGTGGAAQQVDPLSTGNAPYWKFFFSAAKHIWFDEKHMNHRANEILTLTSLLNTHPHADHCQGLYDLLRHTYRGNVPDPNQRGYTTLITHGLIMPSLAQTPSPAEDGNPGGASGQTMALLNNVVNAEPYMARDADWVFGAGVGGNIEYPTNRVISLIRPAQPNMGGVTPEDFTNHNLKLIEDHVKEWLQTNANKRMNRKKVDDINLASILLHIPGQLPFPPQQLQAPPSSAKFGGIYMTGDNNGNIVLPHIRGSHFSIYKIQHHGSMFDSQDGGPKGVKTEVPRKVVIEVLVTMVLLAHENKGNHKLVDPFKTKWEQNKDAFSWMAEQIWTSLTGMLRKKVDTFPSKSGLLDVLEARFEAYMENAKIEARQNQVNQNAGDEQKKPIPELPHYLRSKHLNTAGKALIEKIADLGNKWGGDPEIRNLFFAEEYEQTKQQVRTTSEMIKAEAELAGKRPSYQEHLEKRRKERAFAKAQRTAANSGREEDEEHEHITKGRLLNTTGWSKLPRSTVNGQTYPSMVADLSLIGNAASQSVLGSDAPTVDLNHLATTISLQHLKQQQQADVVQKKVPTKGQLAELTGLNASQGSWTLPKDLKIIGMPITPVRLDWWADWWESKDDERDGVIFQMLDQYAVILSTRAYYSKFTADAYVVSANTKHHHPHAATLVGLALALHDGKRAANLYITNAHSWPWADFDTLARLHGGGGITGDILLQENLHVRYMYDRHMMTLSANPIMNGVDRDQNLTLRRATGRQDPQYVFADGLHDVDQATRPLGMIPMDDINRKDKDKGDVIHIEPEPGQDPQILDNVNTQEQFQRWAEARHVAMESKGFWTLVAPSTSPTYIVQATTIGTLPVTGWLDLQVVTDPSNQLRPRLNARGLVIMMPKVFNGMHQAPQLIVREAWAVEKSLSRYHDQILIWPSPQTQQAMFPRPAPLFLRAEAYEGSQEKRFKLWAMSDTGNWCCCYYYNGNFTWLEQEPAQGDYSLVAFTLTAERSEVTNNLMFRQMAAMTRSLALDQVLAQRQEEALVEIEEEDVYDSETGEPEEGPWVGAVEESAVDVHADAQETTTASVSVPSGSSDPEDTPPAKQDSPATTALIVAAPTSKGEQTTQAGSASLNEYLSLSLPPEKFNEVNTCRAALDALISPANVEGFQWNQVVEKALLLWPVDGNESRVTFAPLATVPAPITSASDDSGNLTIIRSPPRIANAQLVLKPPTNTKLQVGFAGLGGDEPAGTSGMTVSRADLSIEQTINGGIYLTLSITTIGDQTFGIANTAAQYCIVKILRPLQTLMPLANIITSMGLTGRGLAVMNAVDALGLVIGDDDRAREMLYDRLPLALTALYGKNLLEAQTTPHDPASNGGAGPTTKSAAAHLLTLPLDWTLSTGRATQSMTGQVTPNAASIVFAMPEQDKTVFGLWLGPFHITLRSLVLQVQAARLVNETVRLYGLVDISVPNLSPPTMSASGVVRAVMGVDISHRQQELLVHISLFQARSIEDLNVLLGSQMATELGELTLPGSPSTKGAEKTLASPKLKGGSLSLVLRQPLMYEATCYVDCILLSVAASDFGDDWKSWLPDSFPHSFRDEQVDIAIEQPLDPQRRRVRLDVTFSIDIQLSAEHESRSDAQTASLLARLSAIPQVQKGDYEFRLTFDASDSGLSMLEIARSLGLASDSEFMHRVQTEVPMLYDLLDHDLLIYNLTAGLMYTSTDEAGSGKWSWADWQFTIGTPRIDLLANGRLSLNAVRLSLRNYGHVECFVNGEIRMKLEDKEKLVGTKTVYFSLETPTTSTPGLLSLEGTESGGVSIREVMLLFDIDQIDLGLPVVNQLIETRLLSIRLESTPGRALSIQSFDASLALPNLVIGPLEITECHLQVTWVAASAKINQRVAVNAIEVNASAYFLSGDLRAEAWYVRRPDGLQGYTDIGASLTAVNPVNLKRLVDACLPAFLSGGVSTQLLNVLLGRLYLQSASMNFSATHVVINGAEEGDDLGLAINHFHFLAGRGPDETSLQVQSLQLREIKVIYNRIVTGASADDGATTTDHSPPVQSSADSHEAAVSGVSTGATIAKHSQLHISATVEKGEFGATLMLYASTQAKPSTSIPSDHVIAFGLYPSAQKALRLSGILSMLDFTNDDLIFSKPGRRITVWDVDIDRVDGVLASVEAGQPALHEGNTVPDQLGDIADDAVQPKSNSLKLRRFHLIAHTTEPIDIISWKQPPVQITDVRLDVSFEALAVAPAPKLSGVLYGILRLSDRLQIELAFLRDRTTGEEVFVSCIPFNKAVNPTKLTNTTVVSQEDVSLDTLAGSIVMPGSLLDSPVVDKLPSAITHPDSLGARVRIDPTVRVEVWARSQSQVWEANVCGIDLSLHRLAAFVRYTQGDFVKLQERAPDTWEAYFAGELRLKGFMTAEARLSLGPKNAGVLCATLTWPTLVEGSVAGVNSGTALDLFAEVIKDVAQTKSDPPVGEQLSAKPADWSEIVPSPDKDKTALGKDSRVFVLADIGHKDVLITVKVKDYGLAMLWTRHIEAEKSPDKAETDKSPQEHNSSAAEPNDDGSTTTSSPSEPPVGNGNNSTASMPARQYIFIMEARNIGQIWSSLSESVENQWDISKLMIAVIGQKTTMDGLQKELRTFVDQKSSSLREALPETPMVVDTAPPGTDTSAPSAQESTQRSHQSSTSIETAALVSSLQHITDSLPGQDMEAGAYLFAEISVASTSSKSMSEVLLLDTEAESRQESSRSQEKTPPAVQLWAHINKADPKQTKFGINVQNLHLFDGGIFVRGSGKYWPGQSKVEISDALLRLTFDERTSIDFTVNLSMDKTRTKFNTALDYKSNHTVSDPFGGQMFNVHLSSLTIDGTSTKDIGTGNVSRTCTMTATALVGRSTKPFSASIHFVGSSPALVLVAYGQVPMAQSPNDQDLNRTSFSALYKDVIDSNTSIDGASNISLSWPADEYDDFELIGAYLSYNRTKKAVEVARVDPHANKTTTVSYAAGYFIYAQLRLFSLPLSVSCSIEPGRKGVLLSAAYVGNLDLGFLQLTSGTNPHDKNVQVEGVTMKIDTRVKPVAYGVATGMTVLNVPGFFLSLTYQPSKTPSERKLYGTANYQGKFLGISDPGFSFIHQNGKWSFSGLQAQRRSYWPPSKLMDIFPDSKSSDGSEELPPAPFDLDSALQLGSSQDKPCGELSKLLSGLLLNMTFAFDFELPAMKQADMEAQKADVSNLASTSSSSSGFKFRVKWSIDIKVLNKPVGKVQLTEFDFTISFKNVKPTVAGFFEFLWSFVTKEETLEEVGRKVLLDPVVLGELIGLLAVEKLTDELIEKLLCREPKSNKLDEEAKKRNRNRANNKKEKLKDNKRDYDDFEDSNPGDGGPSVTIPSLPSPPFPIPVPPIPWGPLIPGDDSGKPTTPSPDPTVHPPLVPVTPVLPVPGPGTEIFPPGTVIIDPGIKPPSPDGSPLPPPAKPASPAEYAKLSLIDLILLFYAARKRLDDVKINELLTTGIGAKMLKSKVNTLLGEAVQADFKEVDDFIKTVKKSEANARQLIQSRMTLQTSGVLIAKYLMGELDDGNDEASILTSLEDALPSLSRVHERDYEYVCWEMVAIAYPSGQSADTPGAIPVTMAALFAGGRRKLCLTRDPAFRLASKVNIWLRMRVDLTSTRLSPPLEDSDVFVGAWAFAEAKHPAWLCRPRAIHLRVDSASNDSAHDQDQLLVSLPPPDQIPGEWSVELVHSQAIAVGGVQRGGQDSSIILHSCCYSSASPGPTQCSISARDIVFDDQALASSIARIQNTTKDLALATIRNGIVVSARVIQKSPRGADLHDSQSAYSPQSLMVVPPPRELKLFLMGNSILAVWQANHVNDRHAVYLRHSNGLSIATTLGPVQPFATVVSTASSALGHAAAGPALGDTALSAADPNLLSMLIEPDSSQVSSGDSLTVLICSKPTLVSLDSVNLFSQNSLTYITRGIVISKEESNANMTTSPAVLSLVINASNFTFSANTVFSVQVLPSQTATNASQESGPDGDATGQALPRFDIVEADCKCSGRRAVLRLRPTSGLVSGANYVVRASDPLSVLGFLTSESWKLPDISVSATATLSNVTCSWSDGTPPIMTWETACHLEDVHVTFSIYGNGVAGLGQATTATSTIKSLTCQIILQGSGNTQSSITELFVFYVVNGPNWTGQNGSFTVKKDLGFIG